MRVLSSRKQVSSVFGFCLLAVAFTACGGTKEAPPTTPVPIASASATPAPTTAPVAAPAATPAAAPSAAAPSVPAPEQHHGRNSNHPIVEMVFAELPQVGLSAEQKTTVDSLDAELRKQADLIDAPKKQLETDFVDGVSAGKLDKVKVDADVKKLVQAADATVVAMQEAMTKLHKTLDVAQRKKLIEILRAKTEEHHGHPVGAKAEEHREHEKGERDPAEKLAAELGLNADQREKLTTKLGAELKAEKATMKEHLAAMQKRMKIMYDAFESDKFDAKKAGVGEHVGEMVKRMATSRVRFVEAVLSVLTPEQRGKFAEHMRNRDEH